jgi:NAD(P)-dependent dehydrogenase (short-subunit alcohol dehydrogenase family)
LIEINCIPVRGTFAHKPLRKTQGVPLRSMRHKMKPKMRQSIHSIRPQKVHIYLTAETIDHIGKPEEVAELIVRLCFSGASFVTGGCATVDGGYVVQ